MRQSEWSGCPSREGRNKPNSLCDFVQRQKGSCALEERIVVQQWDGRGKACRKSLLGMKPRGDGAESRRRDGRESGDSSTISRRPKA